MSELISGKEALIALANGEEVECRAYEKNWVDAGNRSRILGLFFDDSFQFRLKPRTIVINGIDIPKPCGKQIGNNWDSFFILKIGRNEYMYDNENDYTKARDFVESLFDI